MIMNLNTIQPVPNEPALFIKKKKILVLADLHIGIEKNLQDNGLHICSQTYLMMNRLLFLLQHYIPKKIVFLGDVKHNIASSTTQERNDVKRFFELIVKYGEIHIIKGNHDDSIHRFVSSEVFIHPSDGCVIDDIGFVHGHRWPKKEIMQCPNVIIAHSHPRIVLTDRLGYKSYESCWLRGKVKQTLNERYSTLSTDSIYVIPAFNPLCGGVAVNSEPLLGPFQKIVNIDTALVYLLDGSYLGKVKDIS
jgi:uncharacterized protein